MIELGKYGTHFIVSKSDVKSWYTWYINGDKLSTEGEEPSRIYKSDMVDYKGFQCIVKEVNDDDTITLALIISDPNAYIPIIV